MYIVLSSSLAIVPMLIKLFSSVNVEKLTTKSLPKTFSKEPTLDPSDLLTWAFTAFLYSPDGTNLASRSLFILDFIKAFLTSPI